MKIIQLENETKEIEGCRECPIRSIFCNSLKMYCVLTETRITDKAYDNNELNSDCPLKNK